MPAQRASREGTAETAYFHVRGYGVEKLRGVGVGLSVSLRAAEAQVVASPRKPHEEEAFLFGIVILLLHGQLRELGRRRTSIPLADCRHVARCNGGQVNAPELQTLASVDGHHSHGVEVARLGCDGPVATVLVQKFDPANSCKEGPSARISEILPTFNIDLLAANFQKLIDRN